MLPLDPMSLLPRLRASATNKRTWRLLNLFVNKQSTFNVHFSLVLDCWAMECDLSLWKEPRASFASGVGRYPAAPGADTSC